MSWKFWEKKTESSSTDKAKKLSGPKDLPAVVGRHLVVSKGNDPDWVWSLKAVMRPKSGSKQAFEVRVFSDTDAAMKRLSVKNYNSLDEHADLILFEGWFDKKSLEIHLEEKTKPRAA